MRLTIAWLALVVAINAPTPAPAAELPWCGPVFSSCGESPFPEDRYLTPLEAGYKSVFEDLYRFSRGQVEKVVRERHQAAANRRLSEETKARESLGAAQSALEKLREDAEDWRRALARYVPPERFKRLHSSLLSILQSATNSTDLAAFEDAGAAFARIMKPSASTLKEAGEQDGAANPAAVVFHPLPQEARDSLGYGFTVALVALKDTELPPVHAHPEGATVRVVYQGKYRVALVKSPFTLHRPASFRSEVRVDDELLTFSLQDSP